MKLQTLVFACFFQDGALIFSTFAGTRKGSIRKARAALGDGKWKSLKDRGIRCKRVEIEVIENAHEAD